METQIKHKVAILDCGSQFCKVIDRKIRSIGVYTEILKSETSWEELQKYDGIIISGGPDSVYNNNVKVDEKIFKENKNIPILGICYGMQLLNYHFGHSVEKKEIREDGQMEIYLDNSRNIFKGLNKKEKVLLTHGDIVSKEDLEKSDVLEIIAESKNGIVSAIQHKVLPFIGLQFHPEVDLTENGLIILRNFLVDICNLELTYKPENIIDLKIKELRKETKNKTVITLLSGGVDSTVCYALLSKALKKDRLFGIHIDTGFMRLNESALVYEDLKKIGYDIKIINAQDEFMSKLEEVDDPELKRQIIGDTFMEIADREIKIIMKSEDLELQDILLAQGTLRPDLIESASSVVAISGKSDKIKTHHNDTAGVRKLRELGLILEPLKDFHKDEVREIGTLLGLSEKLVWRQPFPGPGLAIRMLCSKDKYEIDEELLERIKTDKMLENYNLSILPIKSVGVQGDGRTYSYPLVICSKDDSLVNDITEMWEDLMEKVKYITSKYHQINRVIYSLGKKELDNFFVETHLNHTEVNILRVLDHKVNDIIFKMNLVKQISQIPVIMIPISFDNHINKESRSIVLRPFKTNDFMTGSPYLIDKYVINMLKDELMQTGLISNILYDLTSKPPGTTEWE